MKNLFLSFLFISQITENLTDIHVLKLAERVTNVNDLQQLGVEILDLPKYTVDAAVTNSRNSIQSAVYDVLRTWMKRQSTRREAYDTLMKALLENKWDNLATELREWPE